MMSAEVTMQSISDMICPHISRCTLAARRCLAALSQEHNCSAGTLDKAVPTERSVIGLVRRLDFFYRAR